MRHSRGSRCGCIGLMQMRAAIMHDYNEPLRIEEVPVPDVGPADVLVKVAATGMCRSDCQLMEGYFTQGAPLTAPIIPGHEVAGRIAAVGADVPRVAGLSEGDLVVVNPNWGGRDVPTVPRRQRTDLRKRTDGGLRSAGRFRGVHARALSPRHRCSGRTRLPARNAGAADRRRAHAVSRDEEAAAGGEGRCGSHGRCERHRRSGQLRGSARACSVAVRRWWPSRVATKS